MIKEIETIEQQRLSIQAKLDAEKSQAERNQMGQFATPTLLALDILQYAHQLLPKDRPLNFLDPAIGTGSFYSALQQTFRPEQIKRALGYEIDPHYALPATELWGEHKLTLKIQDFTMAEPSKDIDLLICNPPYVRHHHINGQKERLHQSARQASTMKLSGLSGLYCYFLGIAHAWLAPNALSGWLIPSEFMTVNYGKAIQNYLLDKVTLLHIHRFDPQDVQFADALVSSAVVWFRNTPPPADHKIRFTYGGTLTDPAKTTYIASDTLRTQDKWTRFPESPIATNTHEKTIGDYFTIRRGLATGNNSYFIMTEQELLERQLPLVAFRPILPSARFLKADEISADENGVPLIDKRLFLLDCLLPESEIKQQYPKLWAYIEEGIKQETHTRYLCSRRVPWYSQEKRDPSPFICTYIGRQNTKDGRPFRFILNRSQAVVANSYLNLYPKPFLLEALKQKPALAKTIWNTLNAITTDTLINGGRVYGGGLHKLEPKELAKIPMPALADVEPIMPDMVQAPLGLTAK